MSSEVERLRIELSRRISELELRVEKLEKDLEALSKISELTWRIAQLESSAQRFLTHSRNSLLTLPALEEELNEYFSDLKELIATLEDAGMPVDWGFIGRSASRVLKAAKEAGISFSLFANLMVEKLGDYAAKIVDEKTVGRIYGLAELEHWRKLMGK